MDARCSVSRLALAASFAFAASERIAAQAPLTGHYPPGQSGLRGASTPDSGLSVTNFSRFFSNLQSAGEAPEAIHELRYANITMLTWTSSWRLLGLTYGALAGIPIATGDVTSQQNAEFGLGDIPVTPVSLYGKSASF